ncbi:MAG: L-histidine N(alpha)-methyltransferase [Flavobacteriales bacterium]|nr:L-histidine N(alpha)-methyltransferase [Flavobacteriales bacterium]
MDQEFLKDVCKGLEQSPKKLSSKYFYDTRGDRLFKEITTLPEYYLTRAETEILEEQGALISNYVKENDKALEVIEFGSGDGMKTAILLRKLGAGGISYSPIDISMHVLRLSYENLSDQVPEIIVDPIEASYDEALDILLSRPRSGKRLILFLGSNIGNLAMPEAQKMIRGMAKILDEGDHLLLGVDIKKDPETIRRAYSDAEGITAAFNLNLLERMNRELESNFEIQYFKHYAAYIPETGEARSYLVSTREQVVNFPGAGKEYKFSENEAIHTESSWKYDKQMIEELIQDSGLSQTASFSDRRGYFQDIVFRKMG